MSTRDDIILEKLKREFTYVSDPDQYESRDAWYVMRPKKALNHDYQGDCEDFALTLLFQLCNNSWAAFWWSLISRKAKLHFCTYKDFGGHAVLRWRGKYADNIQMTFVSKEVMEKDGYKFHSFLFLPYIVAIKLLLGKFK